MTKDLDLYKSRKTAYEGLDEFVTKTNSNI